MLLVQRAAQHYDDVIIAIVWFHLLLSVLYPGLQRDSTNIGSYVTLADKICLDQGG